jgi:hypothetical protein
MAERHTVDVDVEGSKPFSHPSPPQTWGGFCISELIAPDTEDTIGSMLSVMVFNLRGLLPSQFKKTHEGG